MLVYDAMEGNLSSSLGVYEWSEVQAWKALRDIPGPEWLADQMQLESDNDLATLRISKEYRQKNGNLFGEVVDIDDVREPKI